MSLFSNPNGGANRLRSLFDADSIVRVPGCFDALSARVLEQAGFSAAFLGVSVTGVGISHDRKRRRRTHVSGLVDHLAITQQPDIGES